MAPRPSDAPSSSPAPEPLPLSVVIIARNEAHILPRCLQSVQGWVAEVVVALNETTDASAAVARASGAAVHTLPWRGFRDTKNDALALATQRWALCLDADEEVSPELRASLRRFFAEGGTAAYAGARFPRKVWFLNRWIRHGDWYPDLSLRLIDRTRARWGGDAFVHERIDCDGPVARLDGDLHHYSFPTLATHVAKFNPYAELFLQQQQAKGRRFFTATAILRPAWRFVRGYLLRGGFLDGYPGFYVAVANAFGVFVRHTRLYEAERNPAPPSLPPPAP
jgi:glycosyltransferase involved in cell wall biosynthesis